MSRQAVDTDGVVVPGVLPVGKTHVLTAADGVPVTLDQPLDPRTRFVTIVNGYSGSIVAYAWHHFGDDGEDPAEAMPLDQLPDDAPILLPGRNLLPVPHELRGAEATITFEYTSGEAGSATIYVAEHHEPAVLPAPAVAELKAAGGVLPRRHDQVAVLFADLVAFTAYCEARPPEEVVANLDRLAHNCEALVSAHGLEKIKTLGDGFLATGNLLEPLADPVLASLHCAIAMQAAAAENPAGWRLRVGIHIGPVVAGVVGRSKFSFDLWGDTVNVAARLASLGAEAAIHLSGEAWERVAGQCRCTPLGPIELKGGRRTVVYRCEAVDR